jgi:hypothetical protein
MRRSSNKFATHQNRRLLYALNYNTQSHDNDGPQTQLIPNWWPYP